MQDRFLKRLQKKAKRGLRGWPVASIGFYGPDLSRASKVAVGIIAYEGAEPEMRSWLLEAGDVRRDPAIAAAILGFIEEPEPYPLPWPMALSAALTRKVSIMRANGARSASPGAGATGPES